MLKEIKKESDVITNGIVSDDTCPMTKEVFRKLFNNE